MSDQFDAFDDAWRAVDVALERADEIDLSWIQPPPASDGWTLAPDTLRFLSAFMAVLRPRHVLEFGAGLSTRVLAWAAAANSHPCRISSIDHDAEFGRPQLPAEPTPEVIVRSQTAPLVARDMGGKLVPVYAWRPSHFASRRRVDLAIIDGPPAVLGGREGTLYQLMAVARRGTLVLLDDAERSDEIRAMACWRDNLGDAVDVRAVPGFAKGLGVVLVREPVRPSELWAHRETLSRRELGPLVAGHTTVVLLDQDTWGRELLPTVEHVLPFLERDGQYFGPPETSEDAIRELARLRGLGATRLVVMWPAWWWLEYYRAFAEVLAGTYRCLARNDRLAVFDLGPATRGQA